MLVSFALGIGWTRMIWIWASWFLMLLQWTMAKKWQVGLFLIFSRPLLPQVFVSFPTRFDVFVLGSLLFLNLFLLKNWKSFLFSSLLEIHYGLFYTTFQRLKWKCPWFVSFFQYSLPRKLNFAVTLSPYLRCYEFIHQELPSQKEKKNCLRLCGQYWLLNGQVRWAS